jgi:hypothetical protein
MEHSGAAYRYVSVNVTLDLEAYGMVTRSFPIRLYVIRDLIEDNVIGQPDIGQPDRQCNNYVHSSGWRFVIIFRIILACHVI